MRMAYSEYGKGSDTCLHPCLETSKGPSVSTVNSALVETSEEKFSPIARSSVISAIRYSVTTTVKPHTVAFPLERVLKSLPTTSSLKVSNLKK